MARALPRGHGMGHSGLVRSIANILGAAHAPSRGPDSPMVPLHTLRFLPAMPIYMMYVFTHSMCVLLHLTNGVSARIYGCGGVAAVAPRMFGHHHGADCGRIAWAYRASTVLSTVPPCQHCVGVAQNSGIPSTSKSKGGSGSLCPWPGWGGVVFCHPIGHAQCVTNGSVLVNGAFAFAGQFGGSGCKGFCLCVTVLCNRWVFRTHLFILPILKLHGHIRSKRLADFGTAADVVVALAGACQHQHGADCGRYRLGLPCQLYALPKPLIPCVPVCAPHLCAPATANRPAKFLANLPALGVGHRIYRRRNA